ncbi:hypothetical protein H072_3779 [Dactylellina haptotyla CBS 200.50]|uniref:Uncharacterized protein n=1 Tax=Dactylellina haptotyla (strain CBS 200.50) TaxID=1284197 RepID=S8C3G4_DACHA|nr:hypothetical protein H072_3779 [Dactylellina haptotyla CBS 200.50]
MESESTTNLIDRSSGYQPEINYLVIGPAGCGKTTFLERITTGKIGGNDLKAPYKPYILTNSAQENAPILNFYENECLDSEERQLEPDVLVLCFDIGDPTSLEPLDKLNRDMTAIYRNNLPTIVLGLKRDLRHEGKEGEYIDPMVGYKNAQSLECTGYMECSAVTEELIPAVVEDLVKKGLDVKTGKAYEATGMGNCCIV